jgi:hypothetical protein
MGQYEVTMCSPASFGESCGAKLTDVDNVKKVDQACRVCQTIGIAQRRLRYELGRIDRWSKEPLRFPCSLQKSSKTAWTLQQKIFDLQQTRVSVKLAHRKGIQAQSLGAGQATTLVFQQI